MDKEFVKEKIIDINESWQEKSPQALNEQFNVELKPEAQLKNQNKDTAVNQAELKGAKEDLEEIEMVESGKRMIEYCKEYQDDFQEPGTRYYLQTKVRAGKDLNGFVADGNEPEGYRSFSGENGEHFYDSHGYGLSNKRLKQFSLEFNDNLGNVFIGFWPIEKRVVVKKGFLGYGRKEEIVPVKMQDYGREGQFSEEDVWSLCINYEIGMGMLKHDPRPTPVHLMINLKKTLLDKLIRGIQECPEANMARLVESVVPGLLKASPPCQDYPIGKDGHQRSIYIFRSFNGEGNSNYEDDRVSSEPIAILPF